MKKKLFIVLSIMFCFSSIQAQIYLGSTLGVSLYKENQINQILIVPNLYYQSNIDFLHKNYKISVIGGYSEFSYLQSGNLIVNMYTDLSLSIGMNIIKNSKHKFWVVGGTNIRFFDNIEIPNFQKGMRLGINIIPTYEYPLNDRINFSAHYYMNRDIFSNQKDLNQYLINSFRFGVGINVNLNKILSERLRKK